MKFEKVPPGKVVTVGAPEFLGGMPIRQELIVIPPDRVAEREREEGREQAAMVIEDAVLAASRHRGHEDAEFFIVAGATEEARRRRRERRKRGWMFCEGHPPGFVHPEPDEVHRTDEADLYLVSRDSQERPVVPPSGQCFTSIPVLQFLWGKPWDALALNYVDAVRPSAIRVAAPGDALTCDAVAWRVDVHLGPDRRTILRIEQAVTCGSRGVYHGHDLGRRLQGLPFEHDDGRSKVIINRRGLERGIAAREDS